MYYRIYNIIEFYERWMLKHVLLIHKNNLFSPEKLVGYIFNFWKLRAYFEFHNSYNLPVSPVHSSVGLWHSINKPWILEFALTTFIFAQDTECPSLDKKSYPANQ